MTVNKLKVETVITDRRSAITEAGLGEQVREPGPDIVNKTEAEFQTEEEDVAKSAAKGTSRVQKFKMSITIGYETISSDNAPNLESASASQGGETAHDLADIDKTTGHNLLAVGLLDKGEAPKSNVHLVQHDVVGQTAQHEKTQHFNRQGQLAVPGLEDGVPRVFEHITILVFKIGEYFHKTSHAVVSFISVQERAAPA